MDAGWAVIVVSKVRQTVAIVYKASRGMRSEIMVIRYSKAVDRYYNGNCCRSLSLVSWKVQSRKPYKKQFARWRGFNSLAWRFTQSQVDISFLGRAIETPHVAQFVTSSLLDICSQASLIQNEYDRKTPTFIDWNSSYTNLLLVVLMLLPKCADWPCLLAPAHPIDT